MENVREQIKCSLVELLENPNIRPYLFRTRFERSMIRIIKYAQKTNSELLYETASKSLEKLKSITDKSNTTSCGMLRSYTLLEDNIKQLVNLI